MWPPLTGKLDRELRGNEAGSPVKRDRVQEADTVKRDRKTRSKSAEKKSFSARNSCVNNFK